MRNYNYIYESAQLESFEKQILSGHLTESKLIEMYENNELSDYQVQIVHELFGGLSNIGRAIGGGLKSAGQAAVGGLKSAGQAVGQQAGKLGSAAAQGYDKFKDNVTNMYTTGEDERLAAQQVQQLSKLLTQIQQVIGAVQQVNPKLANFIGKDPTLSNLKYQVDQIAKTAAGKAGATRQGGFTSGVGSAMQKGYNA